MKKLMILLVAGLLMSFTIPAFAQDTHHDCPHGGATIAELRNCVEHALMMGHIDNDGVANSLFVMLDAAQAALNQGQAAVAVNILNALADVVEAQAGQHIDEHHAGHMLEHIQHVIEALGG